MKRPTNQPKLHSWAVYHTAAKQNFVGVVYDQPDEASAIKAAIELYKVPPNEQRRLLGDFLGYAMTYPRDFTTMIACVPDLAAHLGRWFEKLHGRPYSRFGKIVATESQLRETWRATA
jgi:hypothetical protein